MPVDTTVDAVSVRVSLTAKVVLVRTVTVVSMTVGTTEEETTVVSCKVAVEATTVIEEMLTTVGIGILATVELETTVVNVFKGKVIVAVMDKGGAVVEPLTGVAVISVGERLEAGVSGRVVGNG